MQKRSTGFMQNGNDPPLPESRMNKVRMICVAALTLPGCSDATAPDSKPPVAGKWCARVGTFPHASGGTITYENITWLRDENPEGTPYLVAVRGCKVTINPPKA